MSPDYLTLADVIEIVNWKRQTGILTIAPEGEPEGYLYFAEGRIVHAECDQTDWQFQ